MTGEAVRAAMPGAYVSLSSDVLPEIKEYERTCTTVVNAYVGPALELYLGRLAMRLREAGFQGPLLIIQSHGGVATVADAVRLAAGAVLSGPAGGVAGSRHAARPDRPRRSHSLRHGRDEHRHLPDRRAARRRSPRTADWPGSGWACRASTSSASARVAARWRGWMRAASSTSDPRAPGRSPGLPAMVAAARLRRSRTQIWCSATSTPQTFSAVVPGSTRRRLRPRLTGSPRRSASTAWRQRRASIASSTPAWRKA